MTILPFTVQRFHIAVQHIVKCVHTGYITVFTLHSSIVKRAHANYDNLLLKFSVVFV